MADTDNDNVASYKPSKDTPTDADTVLSDASLSAVEAEAEGNPEEPVKTDEAQAPNAEPGGMSAAQLVLASGAPKKSGRGKWIALTLAAITVLGLAGGGYAAYAWYTNPEQVVFDGTTKLLSAKTMTAQGSLEMTTTTTRKGEEAQTFETKSTFNAQADHDKGLAVTTNNQLTYNGKSTDVKAAVVAPLKDGVYIKADGLYTAYKDLVADMLMQSGMDKLDEASVGMSAAEKQFAQQFMHSIYDELFAKPIQKIDGQWIKISDEDIKSLDKDASDDEVSCMQKAFKTLADDKKTADEIRSIYHKRSFTAIKTTDQKREGSTAYDVRIDETKLASFMKELANVPKVKALKECTKNDKKADEADAASDKKDVKTTNTITIWANTWSHTITGLDVELTTKSNESTSKNTMRATLKTNESVKIERPSAAKSLKDALGDMSESFKGMLSSDFPANS